MILPQRGALHKYLQKISESYFEAHLRNGVFALAQDTLSIPQGNIHTTLLRETLLTAFDMNKIAYKFRSHC